MNSIQLVVPSAKYKETFCDYALSYKDDDQEYYHKYEKALHNFDEYLSDLDTLARGNTSNYWLTDNDVVVGVVRIRHIADPYGGHIGYDISPDHRRKGYGSQILSLALKKAAEEFDIHEAIVTCDPSNAGSKRIIEKNGGQYVETLYDPEDKEYDLKFIIKN